MKPATTLGAYGLALVLVFGASLAVGSAVGPIGGSDSTEITPVTEPATPDTSTEPHSGADDGHDQMEPGS